MSSQLLSKCDACQSLGAYKPPRIHPVTIEHAIRHQQPTFSFSFLLTQLGFRNFSRLVPSFLLNPSLKVRF